MVASTLRFKRCSCHCAPQMTSRMHAEATCVLTVDSLVRIWEVICGAQWHEQSLNRTVGTAIAASLVICAWFTGLAITLLTMGVFFTDNGSGPRIRKGGSC